MDNSDVAIHGDRRQITNGRTAADEICYYPGQTDLMAEAPDTVLQSLSDPKRQRQQGNQQVRHGQRHDEVVGYWTKPPIKVHNKANHEVSKKCH